jgi:ABC-type phosphate/phosphonate transport system substrate-binding protein
MTFAIANARMYSATSGLREDWKHLLRWVLRHASLGWDVIDHDPPAPLNALWSRADLGLVMMCGLPYSRRRSALRLLAAPVPSPARYGGQPNYFTDLVVAVDSPYLRLDETFGGVLGYTLKDSMSGGLALQGYLAEFRAQRGDRLYRKSVGDLVHARGVIEALDQGRIDVGPLDSYYHDLLRHNEPEFASRVRVLATTPAMPIPPLVASANLTELQVHSLRTALSSAIAAKELQALRKRLLLTDFAFPDPGAYRAFDALDVSTLPELQYL